MNQILYPEHENIAHTKKRKRKSFKFIFFLSTILILCISFYCLYFFYNSKEKEKISQKLLNKFNLERLYYKKENSIIVELNKNGNFLVIGVIKIPKIRIEYPILSDINDDLLKIAPCKFFGPLPNKPGNMCIAGHNYDDNRFFSKLNKLNIGDIINIYDSNNNLISYKIYNKYEIFKTENSCTSQNTNGKREITLITCNNINNARLIIKAKE